jgi:hypothetical protein
MLIVSFGGLHPLVTASVLLPVLQRIPTGVSDLSLAAAVLLGWGAAVIVAIWAVPVMIASSVFEVPAQRLVLGANLRFAALLIVVGVFILGIVQAAGLI